MRQQKLEKCNFLLQITDKKNSKRTDILFQIHLKNVQLLEDSMLFYVWLFIFMLSVKLFLSFTLNFPY